MLRSCFGDRSANDDDLCVQTKDGVVHITSASTSGASCKKRSKGQKSALRKKQEPFDVLSPKTPLARFSTAKKSGTLSVDEDSPSGSAGSFGDLDAVE